MIAATLVVLAKAPIPGRVKTRLCPPCTSHDAARIAGAALYDTFAAVAAASARHRVLALDGEPGDWVPATFEIVSQRGDTLGERLANVFDDLTGPAVLVGMDTPQMTPGLLSAAMHLLVNHRNDAVLGPTPDGGWWIIGMRQPDRRAFDDVPMSTDRTGTLQRTQLERLGLRTAMVPTLRDVDYFDDALDVARAAPATRFAAEVRRVATRIGTATSEVA